MMIKTKFLNIYFNLVLAAFMLLLTPCAMAQEKADLDVGKIDVVSEDLAENLTIQNGEQPALLVDNSIVSPSIPEDDLSALAPLETEAAIDAEPKVVSVPHSGTYYDASTIPNGANLGGNTSAPREVDPRYEPGSSFVVVSKDAGADSVSARMISAQRALDLGRNTSALELYEVLYSENSKNEQILMGLAVAQQKSGYEESALATYEELLAIYPNNLDAMGNMLGLMKTQNPRVALRRLQDLWDQGHMNANIASEMGLTSATMGQFDESLKYLGMAISMEPNNPLNFYNIAVVNDRMGNKQKAIENYEEALSKASSYGDDRSIERKQIYDRLAHLRRL